MASKSKAINVTSAKYSPSNNNPNNTTNQQNQTNISELNNITSLSNAYKQEINDGSVKLSLSQT